MRFMILIILGLIVLLAIFLGIVNPINKSIDTTQDTAEQHSSCSNWSVDECKTSSKYFQNVKNALNCLDEKSCRKKCSNMGYCL